MELRDRIKQKFAHNVERYFMLDVLDRLERIEKKVIKVESEIIVQNKSE